MAPRLSLISCAGHMQPDISWTWRCLRCQKRCAAATRYNIQVVQSCSGPVTICRSHMSDILKQRRQWRSNDVSGWTASVATSISSKPELWVAIFKTRRGLKLRKELNFGAELASPLRKVCDHVCCCRSVWCSSGGVGRQCSEQALRKRYAGRLLPHIAIF